MAGVFDRTHRRGLAVGIAAGVVIAAAVLLSLQLGTDTATTDQPESSAEIATAFLRAYAEYDAETAASYMSSEASLFVFNRTVDSFDVLMTWAEAAGYRVLVDECLAHPGAGPGWVRCTYDYHGLRSDEIGLEPFAGSWWDIEVAGGLIVSIQDRHSYRSNRFFQQVWQPFANWLHENHRGDLQLLYEDTTDNRPRMTRDAIPLWEERTTGFVEAATGAKAGGS